MASDRKRPVKLELNILYNAVVRIDACHLWLSRTNSPTPLAQHKKAHLLIMASGQGIPAVQHPGSTAFRQAMAEVTAAVHVVTTCGVNGQAGLTASAVTSLSDSPPLMLVCIHRDSRTLAAIEANGVFCINTLSGSDRIVAEVFAGRKALIGEERFQVGDWAKLETGSPVLATSLVAFDCKLVEARTHATHRLIIGEVLAIGGIGTGDGLIYRNRTFGNF